MIDFTQYEEISREFLACWTLAAAYVQRLGEKNLSWFKANLYSPVLEHFSFRLGNQLFFVRLEDSEGRLKIPGNLDDLLEISGECGGHPLVMPMKNNGGIWLPLLSGWGLLNAVTREPVNPQKLSTSEKVEMTPWELHDLAVHSVMASLGGKKIFSYTNHPDISPSVWYLGPSGVEWIIVRFRSRLQGRGSLPANWIQVCESSLERGCGNGYFAEVSFAGRDLATGEPLENAPPRRGEDVFISSLSMRPFVYAGRAGALAGAV
ncbi:MAG: hypothetical protein LBR53_02850 [Deltaproteobacteria bacterium]|jgi:hypothetical protein|nr:hypothetical protein [Deltaproteobacteria bacterium]